ncbi:MAG: hypothetical protein NZ898_00950 [Myxococcota bacterium]|nr:hypothetical protein [Myxococcota bacterium]MDW8360838.1 hypothetical protein [Myxococcales bacterium]
MTGRPDPSHEPDAPVVAPPCARPSGTGATAPPPWRRRVAALVLAAGVAVVTLTLHRAWRRPTDVHVYLGETAPQVVGLHLTYVDREGAAHVARMHWSRGAPDPVRHRVALQPGRWEAHVSATLRDGSVRHGRGAFDVPADGPVELRTGLATAPW